MNKDFENALAWFSSAPADWLENGRKNLASAAEWVWEVLQGDFNDNASTAQVATGTIISMVPFVDQICDIRDLVANCKKIKADQDGSWPWISLVLTLIGLFPSIGSLVKGSLKVMFAALRKGAAVSGVTPRLDVYVGASISHLNRFFARPEVAKTLAALKWDNPYGVLAKELKKISNKINVSGLNSALTQAADAAQSMLDLVKRCGGASLSKKADELLSTISLVRRSADRKLANALKPVKEYLQCLTRHLEIEADMAHRAYLNNVNPHGFKKISAVSDEVAAFNKAKPNWVDSTGIQPYPALNNAPTARTGWPDVKDFHTFHSMRAAVIPPGTTLYRIIDPTSRDNSICWMSESEFKNLKSKSDWRRRFAVWAHWNANGEYVTYTVPEGRGLHVWEGVTASQQMKNTSYVLEGGATQLVINPSDLNRAYIGKRQATRWGYDDLGTSNDLIGVPALKNNFG